MALPETEIAAWRIFPSAAIFIFKCANTSCLFS